MVINKLLRSLKIHSIRKILCEEVEWKGSRVLLFAISALQIANKGSRMKREVYQISKC